MARAFALSTLLILTGCGLKSILPETPVAKEKQLLAFKDVSTSPAAYTGEAKVQFPIIPLATFGLQYAVDVVFVSQHPDWDMHEFARLDVGGQSIWVAKDSDPSGVQTIVSDVSSLETWMPEVAVPRIQGPVRVTDRSVGNDIDIEMVYTNPKGQLTEVWAKGPLPSKPPAKRNGNTMGHSREVVAAVLDIERFGYKLKGGITIDGEDQKFERVLGLLPFKFLLRQTQAGVVVTSFRQAAADSGFELTRPSPSQPEWPTAAVEQWEWDGSVASYDNGVVQFEYRYIDGGLSAVVVRQHGISAPTLHLQFSPALPDFRRPFSGEVASRFVMHVNGQQAHGIGSTSARWIDGQTVALNFLPEAPFWLADRPMQTLVSFNDEGHIDVRTSRLDN